MRDYAKVGPKFWIGETGKKLRKSGMEAQIVAMYLITCPSANMLGLYYVTITTIAGECGLTLEGASKGLQRAIEAGFCEYDEASEVVWVIEMASYQIDKQLAPKDNRVKGVQNEYDAVLKNPFLVRFYEKYKDAFHMASCRGIASPSEAPSKPLRSQEQEQEQEQEQDSDVSNSSENSNRAGDGKIASPTLAGEICASLKRLGMSMVNPSNPTLLMLIEAGASLDEFADLATEIKQTNPEKFNFNYVIGAIKGRRRDAADQSTKVFKGPLTHVSVTQIPGRPQTVHQARMTTAEQIMAPFKEQSDAREIDITDYEAEGDRHALPATR